MHRMIMQTQARKWWSGKPNPIQTQIGFEVYRNEWRGLWCSLWTRFRKKHFQCFHNKLHINVNNWGTNFLSWAHVCWADQGTNVFEENDIDRNVFQLKHTQEPELTRFPVSMVLVLNRSNINAQIETWGEQKTSDSESGSITTPLLINETMN